MDVCGRKEPPEVILRARSHCAFQMVVVGAARKKEDGLSQNRRRRQKEGSDFRETQRAEAMHFGTRCQYLNPDGLGWSL